MSVFLPFPFWFQTYAYDEGKDATDLEIAKVFSNKGGGTNIIFHILSIIFYLCFCSISEASCQFCSSILPK